MYRDKAFTATIERCDNCSDIISNNNIDLSRFGDLYHAAGLLQNNLTWHLQDLYGQISYSQFLSEFMMANNLYTINNQCPVLSFYLTIYDLLMLARSALSQPC